MPPVLCNDEQSRAKSSPRKQQCNLSDLFWQRKSTSARELLSSRRTARWRAVSLVPFRQEEERTNQATLRPLNRLNRLHLASDNLKLKSAADCVQKMCFYVGQNETKGRKVPA